MKKNLLLLLSLIGSAFVLQPILASQLLNISTRVVIQEPSDTIAPGGEFAIGGFILAGSEPKTVIIRALGPSEPSTDFYPHLADPVLELHDDSGGTLMTNNDWKDTQEQKIINTGIPPLEELESAIVATLAPGAYTAVVHGNPASGGTGLTLVEVYDLDQAADSRLANISTRGLAGNNPATGQVLIGGIIVGPDGSGDSTVVIRAIGPSLADFGLEMPLSDPQVTVFDGSGNILTMNDDWMDGPEAGAIAAAGLAPNDDLEAAVLADFAPGTYTAIVSADPAQLFAEPGIALVEIYHLP
jgi:hypothetical protein